MGLSAHVDGAVVSSAYGIIKRVAKNGHFGDARSRIVGQHVGWIADGGGKGDSSADGVVELAAAVGVPAVLGRVLGLPDSKAHYHQGE